MKANDWCCLGLLALCLLLAKEAMLELWNRASTAKKEGVSQNAAAQN